MEMIAAKLRQHWGVLVLAGILVLIIGINIKPGYVLLGNDNFSPELDPQLTFTRALFSPAWRTYRVQGIPSDSEQADIIRAGIYMLLRPVFPPWILSQGYMFLAFFIGSFSMAFLVKAIVSARHQRHLQLAFLFGGLSYLCSMLTIWIFFFPVHLFVAAYAFLPFVLWRAVVYLRHPTVKHGIWVLIATLLFAPAALTATMYLVCALMIVVMTGWVMLTVKKTLARRIVLLWSVWILLFSVHAFWFIPFISYVKTQVGPLQSSAINQDITTTTIENERKHNTALNSVRFFAAWMDTKEEGNTYTFPQRDWYSTTLVGLYLSLIPLALSIIGVLAAGKKRWYDLFVLVGVGVFGWFFIKGANPPLGSIFVTLQHTFPVLAQVFRWQSSKLWPLIGIVIPIFVGIGVIGIAHVFRGALKGVGGIIFILLAGALLLFIHPVFRGQLIRPSMFQQLPAEYGSLAAYLYEHDPHGRIYPAPEANTLYFRNYKWGFWGSVLLNYILPNPVMEKALVIGSQENQQAYTVVVNAYYSRDPAVFIRALHRYDVAWVLSDRNADSQQRGYTYDWELHTRIVDTNPGLENVWSEGKLTLYRVKPLADSSIIPMYAGHDWTKLATLESLSPEFSHYATAELGTLSPFALSDMDWTPYTHAVQGTTKYSGASGQFRLQYTNALAGSVPTQISVRGSEVVLTPAVPTIRINDELYGEAKGRFSGVLPANTPFLTLDRDVVSLAAAQATPLVYSLPSGLILANTVYAWSGQAVDQDVVRGDFRLHCPDDSYIDHVPLSSTAPVTCASGPIPMVTESIAEIRGTFTMPPASKVTFCVLSELERRCLNPNVTAIGNGKQTSFRIVLPRTIQLGDSIKLYLTGEIPGGTTGALDVSALSVHLYQSAISMPLAQQEALELPDTTIALHTGDTIGVSVPLLLGQNSWRLQSDDIFIPETAITLFDAGEGQGSIVRESEKRITGSIREGTLSTYPKWERVQSEGIGMFTYSARNISGIPLEISLRELKAGNKIFQRRIAGGTTTTETALMMLPTDLRSYQLEALHTGIGPQVSQNTLENWSVQMLPIAWTRLQLTPVHPASYTHLTSLAPISLAQNSTFRGDVSNASGAIVTIPTAVSSFWAITPNAMNPVLVNGWQQAWEVPQDSQYTVTFTGNLQSWIGGLAGIMSAAAVLFWVWKWGSR